MLQNNFFEPVYHIKELDYFQPMRKELKKMEEERTISHLTKMVKVG